MKKFLRPFFITVLALIAATSVAMAAISIVPNGGTGVGTITGIIKGNGTSPFTAATSGTDFQSPITLTTTGTSGAATFISNTLNIPQYSGGTVPGGLNTQLQYDNAGVFGGITGAVTDGTSVSLTTPHFLNPTINGAGTGLATLTYPNTSTSVSIGFPATAGTLALTSQLTSGTVTSVATDSTLTGGPITTTGTLGINLSHANTWAALQTFGANITLTSTSPILRFNDTSQTTPAGVFTIRSDSNNLQFFSGVLGSSAAETLALSGNGTPNAVTVGMLQVQPVSLGLFTGTNVFSVDTSGNVTVPNATANFTNTGVVSNVANFLTPNAGYVGFTNGRIYSASGDFQIFANGGSNLDLGSNGNIHLSLNDSTGAATFSSLSNGLVKSTSGLLSNAAAGTDYLVPTGTLTTGSALFATSGQVDQDNANYFYNKTSHFLGLVTSAPTHTLTLGSTNTGIVSYNTSDQTTNYERVRMNWASNIFTIQTENAGTGVARSLNFNGGAGTNLSMTSTGLQVFRNSTAVAQIMEVTSTGLTSSSTIQSGLLIDPVINQSGTGGYTAFKINTTETAVGSGAKLLADFQVGGNSKFSVDNTGAVTALTYNGLPVSLGVSSISTNVAIGTSALIGTNTGSGFNLAIGSFSLQSNTSGTFNTAIGSSALRFNINGTLNVGIGVSALTANTGNSNTVIGTNAAITQTNASGNIAIGFSAGKYTTASNEFYINNVDQTNTANDKAFSLLYGKFSGTAGSLTAQQLTVNGALNANGSILASNGIGYSTGVGAGGTVTQATSKSTGVTLNTYSGTITMNAAALASGVVVSFTVTDSKMTATDVVAIQHDSGGTLGVYTIDPSTSAAGSFVINVRNDGTLPLSEAIVLRFAIIKGSIN